MSPLLLTSTSLNCPWGSLVYMVSFTSLLSPFLHALCPSHCSLPPSLLSFSVLFSHPPRMWLCRWGPKVLLPVNGSICHSLQQPCAHQSCCHRRGMCVSPVPFQSPSQTHFNGFGNGGSSSNMIPNVCTTLYSHRLWSSFKPFTSTRLVKQENRIILCVFVIVVILYNGQLTSDYEHT